MTIKHYNKLVRDKIPQIIAASGGKPKIRIANDAEYAKALEEKLLEEVCEYMNRDGSRDPEELADILEVVRALANRHGLTLKDLEQMRVKKAKERGALFEPIILESVEERDT